MSTLLDIDRLTVVEKLRMMEELWAGLTQTEDGDLSPDWHGAVLREREDALRAGADEFVPWETAKRMLQKKKQ